MNVKTLLTMHAVYIAQAIPTSLDRRGAIYVSVPFWFLLCSYMYPSLYEENHSKQIAVVERTEKILMCFFDEKDSYVLGTNNYVNRNKAWIQTNSMTLRHQVLDPHHILVGDYTRVEPEHRLLNSNDKA